MSFAEDMHTLCMSNGFHTQNYTQKIDPCYYIYTVKPTMGAILSGPFREVAQYRKLDVLTMDWLGPK